MEIRWLRKTAENREWLRNEGGRNKRRKEELKQRQGPSSVNLNKAQDTLQVCHRTVVYEPLPTGPP
jgi:hypothetical protein